MKTKILIECPEMIASVRVGVIEPLKPLEELGCCELRYKNTKDIIKADILWCDILISVRGCEYPTLRVVKAAREVGRFLIYFLDDDLLNIPRGNQSTDYYSDNKIKVNLTKILSLCDALWVVNPRVGDEYSKWCGRTVLSCVPAVPLCRQNERQYSKVRILYAGSVDHTALVQEKLTPAVRRILSESPEAAEFVFIGADPGVRDMQGVSYHQFFDSYDAYKEAVMNGGFSIGLAPAYDSPFYASKYYNKFIEYSTYGICGIYEKTPPYTLIVNDGENGILSGPTAEEWYTDIKRAILERDHCAEMASKAEDLLLEKFNPEKIASKLLSDLPELSSYIAEPCKRKKIKLPPMRMIFYRERIMLLFRIHGILAIPIIIGKIIKKVMKKITGK